MGALLAILEFTIFGCFALACLAGILGLCVWVFEFAKNFKGVNMGAFVGVLGSLVVVGGLLWATVPNKLSEWQESIELAVMANTEAVSHNAERINQVETGVNQVQKAVTSMEDNLDHFYVNFATEMKGLKKEVNDNMNRRMDNIERKMDVIYDVTSRTEKAQKITYHERERPRFRNADYRGQGLRVIQTGNFRNNRTSHKPKHRNSAWEDWCQSNTVLEFFRKRG